MCCHVGNAAYRFAALVVERCSLYGFDHHPGDVQSMLLAMWFPITLCESFTWPAIIAIHPDPSWKRSCYVSFVNAHAAFDIINRLTIMPDRRGSFTLNSKLLLSSLYPT